MRLSATFLPPPHDDHAIGNIEDVWHAVTDENNGNALVAKVTDQVKDFGDLPHRNRRSRLIHQDDLRL